MLSKSRFAVYKNMDALAASDTSQSATGSSGLPPVKIKVVL